jgi:hypothetical protein
MRFRRATMRASRPCVAVAARSPVAFIVGRTHTYEHQNARS